MMKERVEEQDAALSFESLFRDVRHALRGFNKSPGFAAVAIITLALGIGANTAIFQLLDAVRLRSLPIQQPQELAELRIIGGNQGLGVGNGPYTQFTIPMWQEVRRHHDPFSGVFAWHRSRRDRRPPSDGKRVQGLEVSGEFFNVLGVPPWQGRLIEPQDEAGCEPSKVVASYSFWKSQMGGEPITPNTTILVEGRSVQVLGVTPPSFFGLVVGDRFDLAYPTASRQIRAANCLTSQSWGASSQAGTSPAPRDTSPRSAPVSSRARRRPATAQRPSNAYKSFKLAAYPAGSGVSELRAAYDSSLQLLLAITGLVLLIACANLANLMLARASARQREMAIRMALGASRRRMLRQLLIESSLLAIGGAALGVALAQPLSRLLVASLDTSQYSIHLAITTDWRVLLFAAVVATLTCIVFGTIPAMRGASADPIIALKSGERGIAGNRERFSVQRSMVVTQIAVSMVLLVGALLFVRSYRNLMTRRSGHARKRHNHWLLRLRRVEPQAGE